MIDVYNEYNELAHECMTKFKSMFSHCSEKNIIKKQNRDGGVWNSSLSSHTHITIKFDSDSDYYLESGTTCAYTITGTVLKRPCLESIWGSVPQTHCINKVTVQDICLGNTVYLWNA